jgi:hypothetical protein
LKRLLPFVILIVLILAVMIGAPLLLQPDRHKGKIADALSRQLHHHVLIGKAEMGFFPPALRLQDVTIMTDGDEAVLARIQHMDVQPAWGALLRMTFVPDTVTLQQWMLTVRRRADATWDWNTWWQPSKGGSGPGFLPQRLVLHSGECHWVDPFGPAGSEIALQSIEGQVEKDNARLSGRMSGGPVPLAVTFESKGAYAGPSPAWSGDLHFVDDSRQWNVHLDEKDGALDAKGEAREWRADSVAGLLAFYGRWEMPSPTAGGTSSPALFKEWKNHFTWQGSSMTFYHAATLGGGLTELKGDILSAGDHALMHLSGAVQDLPLADVASALGDTFFVDGKLTGISRFEVAYASHPWSSLTGQGSVDIQSGRLHLPDTTLKNLARAKTMAYLKAKFPTLVTEGIPFSHLRAHWGAANGAFAIHDGFFDAGDVKAGWAGRLDGARRGVDIFTRLQIRETNPDLRSKIPGHYLYGPSGHEAIQPIYGHVQGTWSEWSIRAQSAGKVPGALQNALRRALQPS